MKLLKGKNALYIYFEPIDDDFEAKIMKVDPNGKTTWILETDENWQELELLNDVSFK